MDKKKSNTMFGKLLTSVQQARREVKAKATKDLWKRNGLTPNADGYRVAETETMHVDGREVTEYRLYKLIDSTVTTLTADINSLVETGIEQVADGKVLKRK